MEIVFKRRLTNELLSTYLPSFFLLLMSYATTFFKPFYFEAVVTVNLSILLVTTTLFIRSNMLLNCTIESLFHVQCNGEASCNLLCSSRGHLAHILPSHAIHSGKNWKKTVIVKDLCIGFRSLCQPWRSCLMLKIMWLIIMALQGQWITNQTRRKQHLRFHGTLIKSPEQLVKICQKYLSSISHTCLQRPILCPQ